MPGVVTVVLCAVVAVLLYIVPAHGGVSRSSAALGEKCQFPAPDGAVGRCEEMKSCLASGGVVNRSGNIVLCGPFKAGSVSGCCRRGNLVAKALCTAWSRFWASGAAEDGHTCVTQLPLIYGGEEASLGEIPNMAAVGVRENGIVRWVCGGSLITPSFVLTAAHCIDSSQDIVVALGEHDLYSSTTGTRPRLEHELPEGLRSSPRPRTAHQAQAPTEQIINVAEHFVHPDYQKVYHDIGLLRLQYAAELTSRVLPACLPTNHSQYDETYAFTVAGWGDRGFFVDPEDNDGSRKLRKVKVDFVEPNKCWQRFNPVIRPPWGITSDLLCAGSPDSDSCNGDSGGPLMSEENAPDPQQPSACRPRLVVGVVSYGPPCKNLGTYTRVSAYLEWITGIVAPKLLPPP